MTYSIPDTEDDETCLPLSGCRRYPKFKDRFVRANYNYYHRHKKKKGYKGEPIIRWFN